MTRQNRVQPDGQILAVPARGAFMGNRGALHDAEGRLGRARWRHRAWVCCLTEFKGRRRPVMAPQRYTELFFHDEAVALAAGHRPCGECRRADHERFRDAWTVAFGARPTAPWIDTVLHAHRAERGGRRLTRWETAAGALPDGSFVLLGAGPALILGRSALPFAPEGYGAALPRPEGRVMVLTPEPTVRVLAAGYRPALRLPGNRG